MPDATLLPCSVGFANYTELYRLLTVSSAVTIVFADRIKVFDKFQEPLLLPSWSPGSNALVVATGEYALMGVFSSWMYCVTYRGASYPSVLTYAFASLQVSKYTAEAWLKRTQAPYSLAEGIKISFLCHGVVMMLVGIVIPQAPYLQIPIGLLLQLWAYVALYYAIVHAFQRRRQPEDLPA